MFYNTDGTDKIYLEMVMSKTETKICEDCGEEIVMLLDNKGMLIRYKKMCSCITEIMRLRGGRSDEFKKRRKTIRDEMRGKLFYKGNHDRRTDESIR